MALLSALALVGCSTVQPQRVTVTSEADAGPRIVIFVVRRGWHTDIGFNAADIPAPLAAVRSQLPAAHYLLFGFGDQHYLVNHGPSLGSLAGAIWPGPGLVLVTGLTGTPEHAFGAEGVIRLLLTADQARRLEEFVLKTLAATNGVPKVLATGPYAESYYYFSTLRYSGLHTCNTWTAEALKAAGLAVRSVGVEFSGQVWRQVRQLAQQQKLAAVQWLDKQSRASLPSRFDQLQGGREPSWHTTVVPGCAGTTTVVFAGGGGLLLLIQPVNRPTTPKETISAFIPLAS
jgi:hypothetical protein